MGQFSMKIYASTGSLLSDNQQPKVTNGFRRLSTAINILTVISIIKIFYVVYISQKLKKIISCVRDVHCLQKSSNSQELECLNNHAPIPV
ncbi:MAG: hypothetical protein RL230_2870 [Pseudomonadota bacterium]|jgi:hypothetical protein